MASFWLFNICIPTLILSLSSFTIQSPNMLDAEVEWMAHFDTTSRNIFLMGAAGPPQMQNIQILSMNVDTPSFTNTYTEPGVANTENGQRSVSIGNLLYFTLNGYLATFDVSTQAFDFQFALLDHPIKSGCMTKDDNNKYIFIMGGILTDNSAVSNQFMVYKLSTNEWLTIANTPTLNTPRFRFGCNYYHNQIYIFGGAVSVDQSGHTNTIEMFNTINIENNNNEIWNVVAGQLLSDSYGDQRAVQAFPSDPYFYIIGGYKAGTTYGTIQVFDLNDNTISTSSVTLATTRAAPGIVVVEGYIYVFGGWDGSGISNTWERSNFITASPTKAPSTLPTTSIPTTNEPTTISPTTAIPTTAIPTTVTPTTTIPTTVIPTTTQPTTTTTPTTDIPTTTQPTTAIPTTATPTSVYPTTTPPTTAIPTTTQPTTISPTTVYPTTLPTEAPTAAPSDGGSGSVVIKTTTNNAETASPGPGDKLKQSNVLSFDLWVYIVSACCICLICCIGCMICFLCHINNKVKSEVDITTETPATTNGNQTYDTWNSPNSGPITPPIIPQNINITHPVNTINDLVRVASISVNTPHYETQGVSSVTTHPDDILGENDDESDTDNDKMYREHNDDKYITKGADDDMNNMNNMNNMNGHQTKGMDMQNNDYEYEYYYEDDVDENDENQMDGMYQKQDNFVTKM